MQTIKASTTDKELTSFGGLLNFDHLMTKIRLEEVLSPILPSRNAWDEANIFSIVLSLVPSVSMTLTSLVVVLGCAKFSVERRITLNLLVIFCAPFLESNYAE